MPEASVCEIVDARPAAMPEVKLSERVDVDDHPRENRIDKLDPHREYDAIGKPFIDIVNGLATFGHAFQNTAEMNQVNRDTDNVKIDEDNGGQSKRYLKENEKIDSARNDSKNGNQDQLARRKLLKSLKSIEEIGFKSNLVAVDQGEHGRPHLIEGTRMTSESKIKFKPNSGGGISVSIQEVPPTFKNHAKRSKTVNLNNKKDKTKDQGQLDKCPDIEDSPDESSENSDNIQSLEKIVLKQLNPEMFDNKKAKFMAMVYKAKLGDSPMRHLVPELDVLALAEIMEKENNKANLETLLLGCFDEFVTKGVARDNMKSRKYLQTDFEEVYDNYCQDKKSIVKTIEIIRNLSEVGFFTSELTDKGNFQETAITDCIIKPKQTESTSMILKPKRCEIELAIEVDFNFSGLKGDLDSPASKFLPPGGQFSREPRRAGLIIPSRVLPARIDKKTIMRDRLTFLREKAMEDIDLCKDRAFFIVVDNLDTQDGQVSKSYNNSPAKSAKSTTSKRRRRPSIMGSTLQRELISLKKPNIVPVKNFDGDLHRSLRPVYMLEDEYLDKVIGVVNLLVLKQDEKTTVCEMSYFKPEDFVYVLKDFFDVDYNQEFLWNFQRMVKEYKIRGRDKVRIRLSFEETVIYLNKIGFLNDKFTKQASNMFKYDNEDIIAVYEVFMVTKDFKDFCETLTVFQNSKYFEKNQKAKIDLIQGEKTFNLLESIQTYVEEFIKVYYDYHLRRLLTKMVNEANENLIKHASQYQYLTEKSSQELTGYISFNIQLRQFLEKYRKNNLMRKMSIKTESVFAPPNINESSESKMKMQKTINSENFKVDCFNNSIAIYTILYLSIVLVKCTS